MASGMCGDRRTLAVLLLAPVPPRAGWCCRAMYTTAATIATTQTPQAAAHRIAVIRRRGGRLAGRGVAGSGARAAACASLLPVASSPAAAGRPLRSSASTARAAGRLTGSGLRHSATTLRRAAGSRARCRWPWSVSVPGKGSAIPGSRGGRGPAAANSTVRAHASMSAAGVARP
jgi:hypothetical protein